MHLELTRHLFDADALGEECSHSFHFLVREACSRSFTWFRSRVEQGIAGGARDFGNVAGALIPCGNYFSTRGRLLPQRSIASTYEDVLEQLTSVEVGVGARAANGSASLIVGAIEDLYPQILT